MTNLPVPSAPLYLAHHGSTERKFADHRATTFQEAADALDQTQTKIIRQVEAAIDEELFSRTLYPWTGHASLGDYARIVTVANYDWAFKLLRHYRHAQLQTT
ncbi:ClbS/DfsB family four-helix bundle protein [Lacticaseibacillus nasuensis]|uniref:ClbS/DfsB family four-helix bundle protein n=1 Tax=Lacticaseibacillus nasuensis TaxID=944671 RepID=UPI0006CFF893|nr:ClbS/DfsB family four-helix bundle protein [Lacticaseibacillus nasuensis]